MFQYTLSVSLSPHPPPHTYPTLFHITLSSTQSVWLESYNKSESYGYGKKSDLGHHLPMSTGGRRHFAAIDPKSMSPGMPRLITFTSLFDLFFYSSSLYCICSFLVSLISSNEFNFFIYICVIVLIK